MRQSGITSIKRALVLLAVAVLGFGAGWLSRPAFPTRPVFDFIDALPHAPSICVPANDSEREIFNHAISTLELSSRRPRIYSLEIGAQQFLAGVVTRTENGKIVIVCPPDGVYARASEFITAGKGFNALLVYYQLLLASKFSSPSPYIVDAIANSAFNKDRQISEIFRTQDIRPFARFVLAGYGKLAAKYSEIAFQQMSSTDSMGTGAAQVAAATGHPDALPRIKIMMETILASIAKGTAVPRQTRNRLYELSYAIAFAGEDGRPYTAPIKDLMTRRVQSWAPPFGMLEINPKRLCEVLKRIEGERALSEFRYCSDTSPFEQ